MSETKKTNMEILEVENGFVIFYGHYQHGQYPTGPKYVASSVEELGKIVMKLARTEEEKDE